MKDMQIISTILVYMRKEEKQEEGVILLFIMMQTRITIHIAI